MARADAKSPILRACWAILRLLAVAGKQSGEPRPVCRVVGAAVLADGEYADAYVKEQHCRRSVRRGLPLSSKSTPACKPPVPWVGNSISNRHHDALLCPAPILRPAGHSARWREQPPDG